MKDIDEDVNKNTKIGCFQGRNWISRSLGSVDHPEHLAFQGLIDLPFIGACDTL
jgi:hypothetical protein